MTDTPDTSSDETMTLAVALTAAWLTNPSTRAEPDAVPTFLTNIYASIAALGASAPKADDVAGEMIAYAPAVTARKSLASPERIISMIDGKPYRTLRKHLSVHGLTPDQYRARYNLKPDYPMVAPAYSEARREMAKKTGLGRKPAPTPPQSAPSVTPAVEAKPRRPKLSVTTKS